MAAVAILLRHGSESGERGADAEQEETAKGKEDGVEPPTTREEKCESGDPDQEGAARQTWT